MDFNKFYEIGLTEEIIAAIDEIYDDMFIVDVINNIEQMEENIDIFNYYGFSELTNEIIAQYLPLFIYDSDTIRNKLQKLINRLGSNYLDIIASNMIVLEELL